MKRFPRKADGGTGFSTGVVFMALFALIACFVAAWPGAGVVAGEESDAAEKAVSGFESFPMSVKAVNSAMDNLFSEIDTIDRDPNLSDAEKRQKIIQYVEVVRYGPEMKDNFWIMNSQGQMVMDPYLPDLNGTDLFNYYDPVTEERPFRDMVGMCREDGQGYIEYYWPMYDGKKPVHRSALVRLQKKYDITPIESEFL